jgi:hypothetical protein
VAFTIKPEDGRFVLYDDGYVYDKYDTEDEAKSEQATLELESKLSDAVSDAVDDMVAELKEKFPTVKHDLIRQLIVENLS